MVDSALLQFVFYNFLQADIRSVAIFNCWDVETQVAFSQRASRDFLFAQYVRLDAPGALDDFRHRCFGGHRRPTMGVFLDLNCRRSAELLNRSSDHELFTFHHHWLVYDGQAQQPERFGGLFRDAHLAIDADLTYVLRDGPRAPRTSAGESRSSFVLYDVYNNAHYLGGRLNLTIDRLVACDAGACRVERFLSGLHLRSKYGNRCSLQDVTVRFGVVVTAMPATLPPEQLFAFLVTTDNPTSDGLIRYGFNLFLMLVDSLDCQSRLIYMNHWSVSETSGGTVGAMIQGELDMLASPILLFADRLKYLSVLIDAGQVKTTCMFRTPRNTGIKTGVFLEPFSSSVWLIFASVLLVCAVLLWRTFSVERLRLSLGLDYAPSLLTTALIAFGSACSQGTGLVPGSIGGRMAFFSLSLVTFLMYNYYTSMVVSSLLGSPVKSSIRSLGQLADSPLEVAIEPAPYNMVYLNTSPLPDVQRFVQRKIRSRRNLQDVLMSAEEGVRRVRDERGFVFIFEATTGYRLVERTFDAHQICDLNEFPLRPDMGLFIQLHRNSSFKELVRLKQMRMLEAGLVRKQLQYWLLLKLHCFDSNFVVDVGLEYTAPLFLLLLFFYGLCLVLLVLEIAHHRYVGRRTSEPVAGNVGDSDGAAEGVALESILGVLVGRIVGRSSSSGRQSESRED